jgi:predicted metalloprotease
VALLIAQLITGSSGSTQLGGVLGAALRLADGSSVDSAQLQSQCRTHGSATTAAECALVADIDSIQSYWSAQIDTITIGARQVGSDQPTRTVWYSEIIYTSCGVTTADSGPFYCPTSQLVYVGLSFYDNLRQQFGDQRAGFVNAVVLAHEYAHHLQDLLGISGRVTTRTGAGSDLVRLELQADCFAGAWVAHAASTDPPLFAKISDDDIERALQTAAGIGDDDRLAYGGTISQNPFAHGTAAQRRAWFDTGYQSADPNQCDTFRADPL